jgi:hypothetical protein
LQWTIAFRQITPLRARTQLPQDPVDHHPVAAPLPTASPSAPRQQWRDGTHSTGFAPSAEPVVPAANASSQTLILTSSRHSSRLQHTTGCRRRWTSKSVAAGVPCDHGRPAYR